MRDTLQPHSARKRCRRANSGVPRPVTCDVEPWLGSMSCWRERCCACAPLRDAAHASGRQRAQMGAGEWACAHATPCDSCAPPPRGSCWCCCSCCCCTAGLGVSAAPSAAPLGSARGESGASARPGLRRLCGPCSSSCCSRVLRSAHAGLSDKSPGLLSRVPIDAVCRRGHHPLHRHMHASFLAAFIPNGPVRAR